VGTGVLGMGGTMASSTVGISRVSASSPTPRSCRG
jgi:hypothetical protein